MRLLLAEDEKSLSRAVKAILEKIIFPWMPYMTVWRRWNILRAATMTE